MLASGTPIFLAYSHVNALTKFPQAVEDEVFLRRNILIVLRQHFSLFICPFMYCTVRHVRLLCEFANSMITNK